MSNQKKFDDIYWQTCDKKSWFWGHIASSVLNHQVTWYGFDGKTQPKGQRNTISLGTMIGWLDSGLHNIITAVKANGAKLDGLQAAVTELGKKQGIDPAELAKLVDAAVKESVKDSLGTYELTRVGE